MMELEIRELDLARERSEQLKFDKCKNNLSDKMGIRKFGAKLKLLRAQSLHLD